MTKPYFKVTKEVADMVGAEAALLYSHFLALHKNCFKKEFYQSQNQLLQLLPWLNKHSLKKAIKALADHNMIKIQRKGVKNQNYFTVIEDENQWVKNEPTGPTSGHNENPLVGLDRTHEEKIKRKEKGRKEKTLEDPCESITHERTSEQCFEERMNAFLEGEMLDNSIFEETKQKTIIEESIEKKPVSDLTPAMLQFINEFEYQAYHKI